MTGDRDPPDPKEQRESVADGGEELSQTPEPTAASESRDIDLDSASTDEIRERIERLQRERDAARERVDDLETRASERRQRLYDLEGSLAELQGVIEANAEGDLTRRADIDTDVDAVVELVSR